MKRYELLGGLALLTLCILFGYLLWANDNRAPAPAVPVARTAAPALRSDGALMSHPVGGTVVCRFERGVPFDISGSMVTAAGAVYLRLRIASLCEGWIAATEVANYPAWRNGTERGVLIDR